MVCLDAYSLTVDILVEFATCEDNSQQRLLDLRISLFSVFHCSGHESDGFAILENGASQSVLTCITGKGDSFVDVVVRENWWIGDHVLQLIEGFLVFWLPHKVNVFV